jgi:hypothetical protein
MTAPVAMHAIAGPATRSRAKVTSKPPSSLRSNRLGEVISRTERTAGNTSAAIPAAIRMKEARRRLRGVRMAVSPTVSRPMLRTVGPRNMRGMSAASRSSHGQLAPGAEFRSRRSGSTKKSWTPTPPSTQIARPMARTTRDGAEPRGLRRDHSRCCVRVFSHAISNLRRRTCSERAHAGVVVASFRSGQSFSFSPPKLTTMFGVRLTFCR